MINLTLVAKGCCQGNQLLLVLSTEMHIICMSVVLSTELIFWTEAASGASRRANVGLFVHLIYCQMSFM